MFEDKYKHLCDSCPLAARKRGNCLIEEALCIAEEQLEVCYLEAENRRLRELLKAHNVQYTDCTTGAE